MQARTPSTLVGDVVMFIGDEGDADDVMLATVTLVQRDGLVRFQYRPVPVSASDPGFELTLRLKD